MSWGKLVLFIIGVLLLPTGSIILKLVIKCGVQDQFLAAVFISACLILGWAMTTLGE